MFQRQKDGSYELARIHPSALVSLHQAVLLAHLAVECARRGSARLAVTPEILNRATQMAMVDAPAAAQPLVKQRFEALGKVFRSLGLVDTSRKVWTGRRRVNLRNPGDVETFEGTLEHGDRYIITQNPRTFPNALLLPLGISAVTPGETLHAAHEEAPNLIAEAMEAHRHNMGSSAELYEQYLRSAGLEHLVTLAQLATK